MKIRLILQIAILILFAILAACSAPAETPTPTVPTGTQQATATVPPTQTNTPVPVVPTPTPILDPEPVEYRSAFQESQCQFELPQNRAVRCGYLVVPENRLIENSPNIRLHVAIFSSINRPAAPDPIIYLAGGPGSNSLETAYLTFNRAFEPLLFNHELIIFDQRGVGLSQPALICPEVQNTLSVNLGNFQDEAAIEQEIYDAAMACRDRLRSYPADLSAYNSRESAADVDDLRIALGYEQINLMGITYGSRLALTVLRDYPEGVRSVILDSPLPLEVVLDVDTPANVDRALDVFFTGCASDPQCSADFPDLEKTFYALIETLNAEPKILLANNPLDGTYYELTFDGDGMVDLVFNALYSTELIQQLPRAISNASKGLFDTFNQMLGVFLVDIAFTSHGMYYSVQCHEELYFSKASALQDAVAQYPNIAGMFKTRDVIYRICSDWGAGGANPIEILPVTSRTPVLILSGEYDPITPPAYGEMVSKQFTNSFFYEFPGLGHGVVTGGPCPASIVVGFLTDPTTPPDTNCIASLPAPNFESASLTLQTEPFTSDLYAIAGIRPSGWEEISPGTYATFSAALAQASSPGFTADTLLQSVLIQLRASTDTQSTGTRSTFAFTWTLYKSEVSGVALDIAVAEDADGAYIIIAQTPESDRDFYYQNLFLPAVDAYRRK